ncbi:unnamed protein product [marine sediment metagenome]|uniref:Uncharacterized protein n=1 Tax=marine sediment metagenome TaxID=412755 RepID=X0X901_9ZZZZ
MEVYVYHQLVGDSMNAAFLSVKDLSADPPFNQADWELSIKSTGTAASDFDEMGFSDAANGWGGEYNGLSALQGPGTTGFSHMKEFLKSCGSMMTGTDANAIGKSRVGLYTVGFLPSTWWTKPGVTNYYGE